MERAVGVVDHAEPHGVGVGHAFKVSKLRLPQHAVLRAVWFNRLDEITSRRQEQGKRLAGNFLPMLILGKLFLSPVSLYNSTIRSIAAR